MASPSKVKKVIIAGQEVDVKVYPPQEYVSEQEPFEYLSHVASGKVGDASRQFNVLEWWLYETEENETELADKEDI